MLQNSDLFRLLHDLGNRLDGEVSLEGLATRCGWSRFHFHRAFRKVLGETPKQYVLRLRLERAAAMLLSGHTAVFDIALASGFTSHEVFTRAFRRRFGRTPISYRANAPGAASKSERALHAGFTHAMGPCIRLHHPSPTVTSRTQTMPTLSIVRADRAAQPVLLIRRRISRKELQGMLAECFGLLYAHAQTAGLSIAGFPLARYISTGPGLWTVEAAIPLAKPASDHGEMKADLLPGGAMVVAIHAGPYEQLPETNAAIERWIEENHLRVGGAPWEWYVTDPAQHPDSADWRTEVYWPLAE